MGKPRKFTPEFKAKVALAALQGDKPLAALCREHQLSVSGKGAASPPPPPLRTVRESCPSYDSSRPLPSVLPEALSRMGRCVAWGPFAGPLLGRI